MMCAIWTPGIYLDNKTNKMKDLVAEIYRSKKINAHIVGMLGLGWGVRLAPVAILITTFAQ